MPGFEGFGLFKKGIFRWLYWFVGFVGAILYQLEWLAGWKICKF